MSAAVSSGFLCQYHNGNFIGDITNLFLSPRIDESDRLKTKAESEMHCRPLECSLKAS